MTESDVWSVDRLAASNLLVRLQVKATPDALALAEWQFAEHRRTTMEWAAEQARASIISSLEESSQRYFPDQDERWCEGYRRAEQQVTAMAVHEMLQLHQHKPASKGQILRRLVRRARQQ